MGDLITLGKFGKKTTPIIYFPGWTHPIEKEPKFLHLLTKYFTIYQVNLPGYSGAPISPTYNKFSQLIPQIHHKIMQSGLENTTFVGFSMGCRLIYAYLEHYPHNSPRILIGCPVGEYPIPQWALPIINNPTLLNFIRSSDKFKKLAVTTALKSINPNYSQFIPDRVTLTGAFDSLIGLLTYKPNNGISDFKTTFIYGENDQYLQKITFTAKDNPYIIENSPHNCIDGNELQLTKIIKNHVKKDTLKPTITTTF